MKIYLVKYATAYKKGYAHDPMQHSAMLALGTTPSDAQWNARAEYLKANPDYTFEFDGKPQEITEVQGYKLVLEKV